MSEMKENFSTAVSELAREMDHHVGSTTDIEDLDRYLAGELSHAEEIDLQDRLALDREGARDLLDLIRFKELRESRDETPSNHAPTWEAMQARLREEDLLETMPFPTPVESVMPSNQRFHRWALAALIPFVVGLGLWFFQLSGSSAWDAPNINTHLSELTPIEASVARSSGTAQEVRVAPSASRILLVLGLGDHELFEDYGVEILKASGASLWFQDGFVVSALGTFTLELPRRFLPAGHYRIQLKGLAADQKVTIATYDIRLAYD